MEDVFENRDSIKLVQRVKSINVYGVDKLKDKIPLFTIAIPTYKRINTLAEALDSALTQEGYDDYNIIVVDNNPERGDETETFMQKYVNHPKVSYYKNSENVGMAGNWNKCALLSNAEKFILLHDDDILSPFALSAFKQIVEQLDEGWSLIKSGLKVFRKKSEIHFNSPSHIAVRSLSILDFTTKCAVGAPTCILYNKFFFLKTGGYNETFYPCIDYVNSLNLARMGRAYILPTAILGGYRVEINASLSDKMMDKYFYNNYLINYQVMRRCHLPRKMIKLLLSAFLEDRVECTLNYYSMHDYQLKGDQFDIYRIPSILKRIIRYGYRKYVSLYDKIFSKYYIVNLQWING